MRDRNIVQFVGICMGAEEEGIPDEAMLVRQGRWGGAGVVEGQVPAINPLSKCCLCGQASISGA